MDQARWRAALLAELGYWQQRLGGDKGRRLDSVFFGGGTPSLMPVHTVAALLDAARQAWPVPDSIEITLEANPTSAEAEKFKGFAAAGVNRLSLGVQALNDADLQALGRKHDAAQARTAIQMAATLFPRFSFDLIYARKNQTLAAWAAELGEALSMAAGHLSLYQLTIEPDTPFALQTAQGARLQADEDTAVGLYQLTQSLTEQAGLPAYEISNHARPGQESRHNLTYWHYGDYIGIGAGAHGRVTQDGVTYATQNLRAPEAWLAAVEAKTHGLESITPLTPHIQQTEAFLMGLRLRGGIDKARWQQRFGAPLDTFMNADKKALLANLGMVAETPHHFHATPAGLLRLDHVLGQLCGG